MNDLCFVLMPFGKKTDATGRSIDFDAVYEAVIRPAILDVGLEPLRADQESQGGGLHEPTLERLILCDYAIAELTLADAKAFYELGVRRAVRGRQTLALFAEGTRQPFDVTHLGAQSYAVGPDGAPAESEKTLQMLAAGLEQARKRGVASRLDSHVLQLLDHVPPPPLSHAKTDVFRERVSYSARAKQAFAEARQASSGAAVEEVLAGLPPMPELEAGVVVDALLSFRAVKDWKRAITLVAAMPRPLRDTVMMREQLAFALNRAGRGEEAEAVLLALLKEHGPTPETLAILGRVYKDRWEDACKAGKAEEAAVLLERAIDTYLRGFESDWRDAYPGINAVSLMALREPPDPRAERLLPVVRYAVERKVAAAATVDYWDHATLLELAVLASDAAGVGEHLGRALVAVREPWEPETTARNLSLIRQSRAKRGESFAAADEAEGKLAARAGGQREGRPEGQGEGQAEGQGRSGSKDVLHRGKS